MVLAVEGLVGWLRLLGPLLHAGSTYQAENKKNCYSSLMQLVLCLSWVSLLIETKHNVVKNYMKGKDARVMKLVVLLYLSGRNEKGDPTR